MTREELERLRKLRKAAVEGIPTSLMRRTEPEYTQYVAPWQQKQQPSMAFPNGDWDSYTSPENLILSIKESKRDRVKRKAEEKRQRETDQRRLESLVQYYDDYRKSDTY